MLMNFSSEQKSFISSNYFLTDNDNEYDITRDPFVLFEPDNYLNFDNMNFIFNENSFESSKDKTEEKENNILKNNKWTCSQKKLSGRKRKSSFDNKGKFHNKSQNDNILRKINGHFLNFLIDFMNQVLSKCNIITENKKKNHFCGVNGDFKKIINKTNFDSICNQSISQILTLENNYKFKNKNKNRELLNKIKDNNNEILNKILSKKYIDIFKEVFYINKKVIIYEGLQLNLPKTFDDFLVKVKANEDSSYKMRIEEVIKKNFFPQKFNVKKSKVLCK